MDWVIFREPVFCLKAGGIPAVPGGLVHDVPLFGNFSGIALGKHRVINWLFRRTGGNEV